MHARRWNSGVSTLLKCRYLHPTGVNGAEICSVCICLHISLKKNFVKSRLWVNRLLEIV